MRLTVSMALQADHTFFAGSETHKKSMPGVIWEDVVATKHPPFSDRMQLRELVPDDLIVAIFEWLARR